MAKRNTAAVPGLRLLRQDDRDKLMQDEKYQWTGVYDGCASDITSASK